LIVQVIPNKTVLLSIVKELGSAVFVFLIILDKEHLYYPQFIAHHFLCVFMNLISTYKR